MHVTVKGKNLDVPPHIRDEAVAKLSKVRKLFDRFIDMEIVFSEDKNPRIEERIHCEVILHAKGKYLRATAAAADPITAIDIAEAKLARQVRKYKTKVVDKQRRLSSAAAANGHAAPAAATLTADAEV
jgi:putative sigma-54 modulation protein